MISLISENELPFQGRKVFLPCICFAEGETDVTNATEFVSSSLSIKSSLYTWACVSGPLPLHTKIFISVWICCKYTSLEVHVQFAPSLFFYFGLSQNVSSSVMPLTTCSSNGEWNSFLPASCIQNICANTCYFPNFLQVSMLILNLDYFLKLYRYNFSHDAFQFMLFLI